MPSRSRLPIVVLLSGGGTNLQAIIDATARGLPVEIRAVIANRADAFGLERARRAGITAQFIDPKAFSHREEFDAALGDAIERHAPALVVLAGFMRVLGERFVQRFEGRLINIHPSLLPKFRGLHTHQRCIEAGETIHGATVHFVVPELDAGPIILQAAVPVLPGDSPETLAARVLEQEHVIYPQAIEWFAAGRLRLEENRVLLDGAPVTTSA